MKILAVDTAAKSCSVAVVDDHLLLAETTVIRRQTHSKHLMGLIRSVLELAGVALADLKGFAVTRGPGSFTGIRIGLSAVKGLAAASRKPIVGVSTLEALAIQCLSGANRVCALLDARKGEVYAAFYGVKNGHLQPESPERVQTPDSLLQDIHKPCMFIGDGAVLYRKSILDCMGDLARFALPHQNVVRGSSVAQLCLNRFMQDNTDDVAQIAPCYLRKSDAEIKVDGGLELQRHN